MKKTEKSDKTQTSKKEKSAKTITSEISKNANPQVSKKTKKTNKEATNEVIATSVKVQSKNAKSSTLAEEFEKLKQKVVEEFSPINENLEEEFEVVSASSLLNDGVEEIPMLIPPLFHSIGLALLIGSSDIGKSTLLRQLCVSVVTGLAFLGMQIQAIYKRAIYVSSEDDAMSTSYLLKRQNNEYMLKADELEGLSFIFETDILLERLENELQKHRVDVIVIDALTDLLNTDLYKANEVRFFLNQYSQLAKKYQCLIIFLHHTRKNSENVAPSKNNSLGSQAIEAKSRLVLEFKANLNNPTIRHLCPVKGNYIPQELKRSSIDMMFTDNLTFQSLGTNTPFDKINTNEVNLTKLETEYNEIISLKEQGLNYREIGLKFGVSHTSIINKIKRYEKIKTSETIVKD